MTEQTLEMAVEAARLHWARCRQAGAITPRTEQLYGRVLRSFEGFAKAQGAKSLSDVTPELMANWVNAPISGASPGSRGRAGQPARPATRRNRQVVLRSAADVWVEQAWMAPELLPDATIRPASQATRCPLTPTEVEQLRIGCRINAADTLHPAMVEIALAGGSQVDIASVTAADLDLEAARLRLRGRGQRRERWVPLTAPGLRVLQQRSAALAATARKAGLPFDPADAALGLASSLSHYAPQSLSPAVASGLHRALATAGIDRAGVRPSSLQEFAANRCYALTNRVEDVAELLGMRSLDAAFRLIDGAWQDAFAAQVRAERG